MLTRALVITLLVVVLAAFLAKSAPILDARLSDLIFGLRGSRHLHAPVTLISLPTGAAGEANPWGASLTEVAQAVRLVSEGKPSCIVLSMTRLTLAPPTAPGLAELCAAVRDARCVVLPSSLTPIAQHPRTCPAARRFSLGEGDIARPVALSEAALSTPPDALVSAAAGLGSANLYPELDGVVRSFPLVVSDGDHLYPSLPLEAVRIAGGIAPADVHLDGDSVVLGASRIPVTPDGAEVLLDYPTLSGPQAVLDVASLEGSSPDQLQDRLHGQVVILSVAGLGGSNLFATPAGPPAYGAEIVAAAVENLLAHHILRSASILGVWGLALTLALVAMFFALRLHLATAMVADLALVGLAPVGLAIALYHGLFIPALCPLVAVLLAAVGNIALAGATAERRRTEDTVRFSSRLQAIEHFGDLLGIGFDRRQLLGAIMRWVGAELGTDSSSVMLLDHNARGLRFEVAFGPGADAVRDFVLPLGHGIAGRVAETGEPIISNDLRRDPRHASDVSDAVGRAPRNLICVPMRLRGEVVGVLEAMDKDGGAPFDAQDLDLLATIAEQAALLLENARLYAELQDRVDFANTELRGAYRELSSEKAKVDTLINQLPSPIIATDANNAIVLLNAAAEELLRTTEASTIGKSVYAAVPVPDVVAFFAADLSGPGRAVEEMAIDVGDARRIFRVSLALVRDLGGAVLGKSLVMIDITELRELDQMKTDLISFVSHELRNPLGIISGTAQLAGRRIGTARNDDVPDLLGRIDRQTRRMERLVDDFLNIARLEAGRPLEYQFSTVTDICEIVRVVVELEPRRTEAHNLVSSVPDDLPPIRADRGKLEEVFTNLVGNAVKYSPSGGAIEVSAVVEDGFVRFAVSDHGLGVPDDQLGDLFGKYRRVRGEDRARVPGTGLGLYLCKQIVEGHGGRIWAESVAGQGSTFIFTVPIAREGGPDA